MYCIKNKITGAESYTAGKPLRFYMSLPHIKTGANLTLTIICNMFNQRIFDKAVDIYINWDGSKDQVNYTVLFGLAHLLVSAEAKGWPLSSFVLLRLQVGHTHNHLDATFAQLSKEIYGVHSRGDARRDVLDFKSLEDTMARVYGSRLKCVTHIRGCFNFDDFVAYLKESSTSLKGSTSPNPNPDNIDPDLHPNLCLLTGVMSFFMIELR